MLLSETVIEGTIMPDGTLVLDQKPNLWCCLKVIHFSICSRAFGLLVRKQG